MANPKNKPEPVEKARPEDVPPLTKDRLLDIRKDSMLWKQIIAEDSKRRKALKGNPEDDTSALEATDNSASSAQEFLRTRIDEFLAYTRTMNYGELKQFLESELGPPAPGFDPYGSEDELGLHEGNADLPEHLQGQDDYEIEEVQDGSQFLYDYGHRIEVEVNSGSPRSGTPENEASCEFTFEYHRNGKLVQTKQVPSSYKLEDKFRPLSLEDTPTCSHGKKKRKNLKRTKKADERPKIADSVDDSQCLFCQYEEFFGKPPIRTMEWLEKKAQSEEQRRAHIREKLRSAKMRTVRKKDRVEEIPDPKPEGAT